MTDQDPKRRRWWLHDMLSSVLGELLFILLPFLIVGAVVVFFVAQQYDISYRDALGLSACLFLLVFGLAGGLSEDCGFIGPGVGVFLAIAALAIAGMMLFLSVSIVFALPIILIAIPVIWLVSFVNG